MAAFACVEKHTCHFPQGTHKVPTLLLLMLMLTVWQRWHCLVQNLGGCGIPTTSRATLMIQMEARVRCKILRLIEITIGNTSLRCGCCMPRMWMHRGRVSLRLQWERCGRRPIHGRGILSTQGIGIIISPIAGDHQGSRGRCLCRIVAVPWRH